MACSCNLYVMTLKCEKIEEHIFQRLKAAGFEFTIDLTAKSGVNLQFGLWWYFVIKSDSGSRDNGCKLRH